MSAKSANPSDRDPAQREAADLRARRANPEVADTLIDLLAHENVVLTDLGSELASAAIAGVRHLSPRHIVDALICAGAHQAGATRLLTHDSKFASRLVPVVQLEGLLDEDGATPSTEAEAED